MLRTLAFGLLLIGAACAGCQSLEPDYRAADLTFDDGLVGRWKVEADHGDDNAQPDVVRIEVREVSVRNGRLHQQGVLPMEKPKSHAIGAGSAPKPQEEETARVYTITLERSDQNKREIEFSGFLFRAGEQTLAGIQVSQKHLAEDGLFPLVLPLHFVGRYQRDGDTVTWQGSNISLAWMPLVTPLDEPATDSPDVPPLARLSAQGHVFIGDIDRLVRVYTKHASEPAFWGDKPITLHRVVEKK